MSLTVRVLIGLVAGLLVGFGANAFPGLRGVIPWIEPLGSVFINAIRMTVVPLVVASLVVGVAGASDVRAIGRVGWRRSAVSDSRSLAQSSAQLSPAIIIRMIDTGTAARSRKAPMASHARAGGAQRLPSFAQWQSVRASNPFARRRRTRCSAHRLLAPLRCSNASARCGAVVPSFALRGMPTQCSVVRWVSCSRDRRVCARRAPRTGWAGGGGRA